MISARDVTMMAVVAAMVLATAGQAMAETPYTVAWSCQPGTPSGDDSHSVAVDGSGSAFISGTTAGNLGGTSYGNYDAFLVKYNSSGNLVWKTQFGSSNNDFSCSVAVDQSGNALIGGRTDGSLGGTNAGKNDAFLAKCDSSGTLLWSRQLGTSANDEGYSVAVDGFGGAFIAGRTQGSLFGTNAGQYDAFLAKYNSSGTLLWSRQLGTSSNDWCYDGESVAVDGSGSVFITGMTAGSLFGTNAGQSDVFLAKYDGSGTLLWSRQFGTSAYETGYSVAVDGSGNAFVTGYTSGALGGTYAGNGDAFLVKYDNSGTLLWSQQLGTSAYDEGYSVAVDGSGSAFITGRTRGSLGGTNAGDYDVFLAKYDSSGNFLWAQQLGTSSDDNSYSVAVDGSGNAFISGYTWGSLCGTNAGASDAFLVKYTPEPATLGLLAAGLGALWLKRRRR